MTTSKALSLVNILANDKQPLSNTTLSPSYYFSITAPEILFFFRKPFFCPNYSSLFTLLYHCYVMATMGMYPGMNYVCLIQETIFKFIHGHNNGVTLQLLYSKIHMSILMSNLISCDMMEHPAENHCTCVSGYYGLRQWIIFFFEWPLKSWPPHNLSLNPVYFIIGGQAD